MQRIQQSLEVAQTPREPSVTPRGGSNRVRPVPRNPWLDRETSHERLVREQSCAKGETDQPFQAGVHCKQPRTNLIRTLPKFLLLCCVVSAHGDLGAVFSGAVALSAF